MSFNERAVRMKIKKISILLPVYNESDSIDMLASELNSLEIRLKPAFVPEFIWIDDGSDDGSLEKLKILYKGNNKVRILSFTKNFGKTSALQAGIDQATGDYIASLDTDLQDDPKNIARMLELISKRNLDFVIGNRTNKYDGKILKKVSSNLANILISVFFRDFKVSDVNCGLKVMKAEVAKSLFLKSDYHRYIPLIAYLNGYRVGEMDVIQRDRKHGQSKYGTTGLKRTWKSFSDLIGIIFTMKIAENPFSFFGRIGLLFCFVGISLLTYISILWLGGEPIDARPLFFLGILCVITGINMLSTGLIGDIIQLNSNSKAKYKLKFLK